MPRLPVALHDVDEQRVEFFGRVDAVHLQHVVHRDYFGDYRDVLPGEKRNHDLWQLHVENAGHAVVEAGPVPVLLGVPLVQEHFDFDALLNAHGADAEEVLHVDDADATDLHEMPQVLVAAADQHVLGDARHVHGIVGDQAMAALDQVAVSYTHLRAHETGRNLV